MKSVVSVALALSVIMTSCGGLMMLMLVGELWKEMSLNLFLLAAVATFLGIAGICLCRCCLHRHAAPNSN